MIAQRKIESGPPGPGGDFIQVGEFLREKDASPSRRAALFEVAARLPGVQDLGRVTDHAGRVGVGLAMDDRGLRDEVIFAAGTSALLGEQQTIVDEAASGYDAPAGTVVGWAVYLSSSIVDALPPTTPRTVSIVPARAGDLAPSGSPVVLPRQR